MKRSAVILLMFLYLVPAVGVTVSAHYCGSINTSVSYNPFDTSHKCACGSEKMKNDCCKDENSVIKLNNDQHQAQPFTIHFFKTFDFPALIAANCTSLFQPSFLIDRLYKPHHPPDNLKQSLYLLHRVFLI
jgi:hypothetical protein